MNSPRSLRSPKGTPTKDARPFVYLYKIDFPDNPGKRIRLPATMKELFKLAGEVLELNRPAKQVFDEKNNAITELEKIEPKSKLFISCANPTVDPSDQPLYKSRLPRDFNTQKINLPTVKQPKPKPRRDDAIQHQAIAASPYTVKENLRDSMLSLFASLTPDHKAHLPSSLEQALTKLTSDTQQFCLEESMLSQFIGPSSVISNTLLGQKTTQWMMEQLKGMKAEDCKFVITGPSQSGKSTLLSIAVSLFYQKLQLANETANYLIVPINWLMHDVYIADFQKLYGLIVATTLNSLRYSHMQYIPILNSLHQWFMALVNIPAMAPIPPSVLHFTGFPVALVQGIGRNIHKAWNSKGGLEAFLTEVSLLPSKLAHAFGFKAAVLVFDHFEATGFVFEPNDHFSEAEKPVDLAVLFSKACEMGPYFVASQDDADFGKVFKAEDVKKQLTTERIITDAGERELVIPQPAFHMNMEMCKGCPGYCALFIRLCDLAKEAMDRAAVKSQFSRLKSVVDISRNEMLKQEFTRLCLLLAHADADNFSQEQVNNLLDQPDFTVRVR